MPGVEEKITLRDIIERIRTEGYLLDIDEEPDRVKRGTTSLHKNSTTRSGFCPTTCIPKNRIAFWGWFRTQATTTDPVYRFQ